MVEEKKKNRFDMLCNQLTTDVSLNEVNIREKALLCPALKVKWIRMYHEENRRIKQLKLAERQVVDSLQKLNPTRPRFQCENDLLQPQADGTPGKLVIIKGAIEEQEQIVDLMKSVVNIIIDKLGFDIGNCIKLIDAESR